MMHTLKGILKVKVTFCKKFFITWENTNDQYLLGK